MRARPAQLVSGHIGAPMGGLNTISSVTAMPPKDCVLMKNMVAGEFGLRVRSGWREWARNINDFVLGGPASVRTVFGFNGSKSDGSRDMIFAAINQGIYRLDTSGAYTPAPSTNDIQNWGVVDSLSGFGTFLTMSNAAQNWGIYCDESNGYLLYDETATISNGWNLSPTINNVDGSDLVFPCVFKRRLWFVERDSTRGWYLDVDAVQGDATSFNFGAQFRNGGTLVGLWNWTYDGGSGPDDRLVAISSNGDVVIYQGTDPDSADAFGIVGVWNVGGVVSGRNIATPFGGDMLIMSTSGLVPLLKLVAGTPDSSQYPTAKIQNLFRRLATDYGRTRGWSIVLNPVDNVLMITIPSAGQDQASTQLVMSISTGAWGQYVDLPIVSACMWRGELYFGGSTGYLGRHTGTVDAVLLSDPSQGTPINWSVITAYRNLGTPKVKQVQTIRPYVSSDTVNPEIEARALYNFDVYGPVGDLLRVSGPDSRWDFARWDEGVWGGDNSISVGTWGATGMGRHVALAIRGKTAVPATFLGSDVDYTTGGEM